MTAPVQLAHPERKHESDERRVACAVPLPIETSASFTPAEWAGAWIPLVLWVGVIWFASGERFAATHTEGWLAVVLSLGVGDVAPETFARIHFLVRKGAHLVEYCMFGLLLCRAVRRTFARRVSMLWRVAVWQVPWLLAAIDEIHQFLVPGRTGSVGDVGIDVLGAWLGLAVWRRWSTYGGGA